MILKGLTNIEEDILERLRSNVFLLEVKIKEEDLKMTSVRLVRLG